MFGVDFIRGWMAVAAWWLFALYAIRFDRVRGGVMTVGVVGLAAVFTVAYVALLCAGAVETPPRAVPAPPEAEP